MGQLVIPARGFSLLEVLIAVFVLSVGFLGVAAMQISALQTERQAGYRGMATRLGYAMVDRMRDNLAGVEDAQYNALLPSATAANYAEDCEAGDGFGSASVASPCTADVLALADFSEWLAALATSLPGGWGAVCIDDTPDDGTPQDPQCDTTGSHYAVKVWWDSGAGATPVQWERWSLGFLP